MICLLPVLLLGPLPVCAETDSSAALAAFLEEPDAFRPGSAPLPLDGSAAVVTPEPARVFEQPMPNRASAPPDGAPDVQFSHPAGGGYPCQESCPGGQDMWGPGQPGLLGRQPLRQMLRDIYGPIEGR
ncbi:MAG: hypothetical protein U1E05_13155, partial [Patescibacteria group bacterium]|nr:hypothetical protein [Patescibacteria group bacterium]